MPENLGGSGPSAGSDATNNQDIEPVNSNREDEPTVSNSKEKTAPTAEDLRHLRAVEVLKYTKQTGEELSTGDLVDIAQDLVFNAEKSALAESFLSAQGMKTFESMMRDLKVSSVRVETASGDTKEVKLDDKGLEAFTKSPAVKEALAKLGISATSSLAAVGVITLLGGPISWATVGAGLVGGVAGRSIGELIRGKMLSRKVVTEKEEEDGETVKVEERFNDRVAATYLTEILSFKDSAELALNDHDPNIRAEAISRIIESSSMESGVTTEYKKTERIAGFIKGGLSMLGAIGSSVGESALLGRKAVEAAMQNAAQDAIKTKAEMLQTGVRIFHDAAGNAHITTDPSIGHMVKQTADGAYRFVIEAKDLTGYTDAAGHHVKGAMELAKELGHKTFKGLLDAYWTNPTTGVVSQGAVPNTLPVNGEFLHMSTVSDAGNAITEAIKSHTDKLVNSAASSVALAQKLALLLGAVPGVVTGAIDLMGRVANSKRREGESSNLQKSLVEGSSVHNNLSEDESKETITQEEIDELRSSRVNEVKALVGTYEGQVSPNLRVVRHNGVPSLVEISYDVNGEDTVEEFDLEGSSLLLKELRTKTNVRINLPKAGDAGADDCLKDWDTHTAYFTDALRIVLREVKNTRHPVDVDNSEDATSPLVDLSGGDSSEPEPRPYDPPITFKKSKSGPKIKDLGAEISNNVGTNEGLENVTEEAVDPAIEMQKETYNNEISGLIGDLNGSVSPELEVDHPQYGGLTVSVLTSDAEGNRFWEVYTSSDSTLSLNLGVIGGLDSETLEVPKSMDDDNSRNSYIEWRKGMGTFLVLLREKIEASKTNQVSSENEADNGETTNTEEDEIPVEKVAAKEVAEKKAEYNKKIEERALVLKDYMDKYEDQDGETYTLSDGSWVSNPNDSENFTVYLDFDGEEFAYYARDSSVKDVDGDGGYVFCPDIVDTKEESEEYSKWYYSVDSFIASLDLKIEELSRANPNKLSESEAVALQGTGDVSNEQPTISPEATTASTEPVPAGAPEGTVPADQKEIAASEPVSLPPEVAPAAPEDGGFLIDSDELDDHLRNQGLEPKPAVPSGKVELSDADKEELLQEAREVLDRYNAVIGDYIDGLSGNYGKNVTITRALDGNFEIKINRGGTEQFEYASHRGGFSRESSRVSSMAYLVDERSPKLEEEIDQWRTKMYSFMSLLWTSIGEDIVGKEKHSNLIQYLREF